MSVTRWGLLPDVLGIGPARTGTTWLHEKLSGRVDLPRSIKETKFFERYHARGVEWYASLFQHCKGDRPIAEICPYLAGPHAPEWIAEVIPNCKLIVTLRDPVDRMYSHYKMMRGYAFTRLPVEEALKADRFLAQGSLYASNLERWFAIFPRSNFLITLYEDLRQRPQAYLDCISDFIGIERIPLAQKKERRYLINTFDRAPRSFKLAQNARHLRIRLREKDWNRSANLLARMGVWGWCAGGGAKFPPLTPGQDARFRELYLPEIEALEKLLGCDLSAWKRPRLPSADQVVTSISPRAFAQSDSPSMNSARRLPDFIAVGPQRTGTTWLHRVLAGHIGLPSTKETDFFVKHFEQGLDWYLAYFSGCPADRPMGEVNPNYFGIPQAYERIARTIAHCKIVVSLRDPTERAWSSYRTMRRDAWTRVGFEETITRSEVIRESSRYAFHLGNLRRLFGADRVLVLFYEDLEANPQSYLDQVCNFIGAPPISIEGTAVATERVNAVTHAPRSRRMAQNARNARDWMLTHRWHRTLGLLETIGVWRRAFGGGEEFGVIDPAVEAQLRDHFRPEVEALEQMIGRDLRHWKGEPPPCRASTS